MADVRPHPRPKQPPPPGDTILRIPRGYTLAAAVCVAPDGSIGVLHTDPSGAGLDETIAQLERAINYLRTHRPA